MKGIDLELQSKGSLSVETDKLQPGFGYQGVEIGLKISVDGRFWICIDGQCVFRFKPREGMV